MNEKEWGDAYRRAIELGRVRVGEPPTPEEMMAYARGDLPAEQQNRIRELLVYYPDLADALLEEAESRLARPPQLSEHQLAQDWRALQNRMKTADGQAGSAPAERIPAEANIQAWRWGTAAAVLVCLFLGGLYFRALRQISDLHDELRSPRVDVESISLYERNSRGSADSASHQLRLRPTTRFVSLNLTLAAETSATQFRVELVDRDAPNPRTVWASPIYRGSDGSFTLEIPRSFLTSTRYRVQLFAGNDQEPIAWYSLRVSPLADGEAQTR
jgi:hypothetical protein